MPTQIDPFTQRKRKQVCEEGQLFFPGLGECSVCKEKDVEIENLRSRLQEAQGERFKEDVKSARIRARKADETKRVLLAFRDYFKANPEVWKAIRKIVRAHYDAGRKHLTIRSVWEGLRTHTWIPSSVRIDGDFKLPDHYTAIYVRLLIQTYPEYKSLFSTKATCRFEGADLMRFLWGGDDGLEGLQGLRGLK